MLFISDYPSVVRRVQLYLYELGQIWEGFPLVYPDGIFGKETADAVKAFQVRAGLSQSGKVDFFTWTALVKAANDSLSARRMRPVPSLEDGVLPLTVGDRGHGVILLRSAINEIAAFYPGLQRQSPTSLYQYSTAVAVRELQRIYRMPETGVVDVVLWNRLFSDLASKHSQ